MQKSKIVHRFAAAFIFSAVSVGMLWFVAPAGSQGKKRRVVLKPGQLSTETWRPLATFDLGGDPDWMAITEDAVWVANEKLSAVQRIDPRTNKVETLIRLPGLPCAGLAYAFGSLWVPVCGEPRALMRIDPDTNKVSATLPFGPADSEGSITASEDSIWIVVDTEGSLLRIDPDKNEVRQVIQVPGGSFNPLYHDGIVWVSGTEKNVLTPVNAATGEVLTPIPVGPKPRFSTAGAGSIWTLNQGDGSVTRVDEKKRTVTATIAAGIPGHGGEICFGAGAVWATMPDVPLTKINALDNRVETQWVGPGGDSVRFGHGTVWLTDLKRGLLWRLPVM